ncbi:hypothetical protein F4808DRAFT_140506 [Astrocystis sublimbata]|nr:hypothetical protein F4808DRAFT_101885 [Astrocystis sublimbata]KAI0186824.1 hypothetical protein F4808DRAFT_469218 [Astrocystis sublimbata]KAI0200823.1 hypothetical protein F4808DRAFT_140506 [Astrocystis sublimbata]
MSLKACTVVLAMMAGTAFAAPKCGAAPNATYPAVPTKTCEDPPNQTTGYPDYNSFCKCPAETETAWGNPYLGLVRCDTQCTPKNTKQRESHNDSASSLEDCMNACTGSFEKAKRQENIPGNDDYWFCHGVNFIEGELCEFFGTVGEMKFEADSGSDCWYQDGLD